MQNLPKHFVLQLGSLISLYISLSFLLTLLFAIINLTFTDDTDSVWQLSNYNEMVRVGIAFTVVFFPTYIVLTRLVNQARRAATETSYLTITKWLIYLSLLVGGAALLGNLVTVIITYLNGEITERFILKSLSVLFVVGIAFYYYLQDARGHWIEHEQTSKLFGVGALVFVLATVGYGLMVAESPSETRERKLDTQQLSDLQDMDWRINDHYYATKSLPGDLSEVYVNEVPSAPTNREAYEYSVLTETTYELCATFANDAEPDPYARPVAVTGLERRYNWEYQAGRWCFEREVDTTETSKNLE